LVVVLLQMMTYNVIVRTGINRKCETCGKEIYLKPYEIALGTRKYCSLKCKGAGRDISKEKNPRWHGGRPRCPICNRMISYGRSTCNYHKPTKYPVVDGKKQCKICKEWLDVSNFYKSVGNSGDIENKCKVCHRKFRTEPERWKKFLLNNLQYKRTAASYFSRLIIGNKSRHRKEINITRQEFIDWDSKQDRKCFYCDIPEEIMLKNKLFCLVKGNNIFRLTIDRKDNDIGYQLDNIVLACPICNMTKGSVFGAEEFKKLAIEFIKPKWNEKK
jgi:hypothetical protein